MRAADPHHDTKPTNHSHPDAHHAKADARHAKTNAHHSHPDADYAKTDADYGQPVSDEEGQPHKFTFVKQNPSTDSDHDQSRGYASQNHLLG
jgi:hypothetical protein